MAQVAVTVKRSGKATYTRDGKTQAVDIRGNSAHVSVIQFKTGPVGAKPAHRWTGTALAFENNDGTYSTAVELKGEAGNGIENFSGDPLTHFILALN